MVAASLLLIPFCLKAAETRGRQAGRDVTMIYTPHTCRLHKIWSEDVWTFFWREGGSNMEKEIFYKGKKELVNKSHN